MVVDAAGEPMVDGIESDLGVGGCARDGVGGNLEGPASETSAAGYH